jgi:UDP-2,3-diacylglucosamine pyrophosphatase LpxH
MLEDREGVVMKTYLIGDTHICDGTGPFFKNKEKLMRFLDMVDGDNLVILGDCIDLWRWSAKEICNGPNRDVIERLTKKSNVSIIVGNHDLDLKLMSSIFQQQVYMSSAVSGWWCMHGHQLDSKLDTPRERKIVKEISLIIQKIDSKLLNRFRDWATSGPRSNAEYKTKFQGVKLAMGHTHVPEVRETYLNPGSWTGDNCHAIVVSDDTVPTLITIT